MYVKGAVRSRARREGIDKGSIGGLNRIYRLARPAHTILLSGDFLHDFVRKSLSNLSLEPIDFGIEGIVLRLEIRAFAMPSESLHQAVAIEEGDPQSDD
jgi:hypothetical protein